MRGKRDTGCLTPFLKPSLSNDGDIAHGFFTPSLMPLHACSTEREREEGRGERREKEKERERRRGGGGGSPSLHVTLPPFLSRSLSQSCSLPLRNTHKHTVCMCMNVCRFASCCGLSACLLLFFVVFFSTSFSTASSCTLVRSPDLPPYRE